MDLPVDEIPAMLKEYLDSVSSVQQWKSAAELMVKDGDVAALRALLQGRGAVTRDSDAGSWNPAKQPNPYYLQDRLCEITPLHLAAAEGRQEVVRFLLTEIALWLVNVREPEGRTTALHACARSGHVGIAMDLLANGADVHLRDAGDCTALHIACEYADETFVRLLLDAASPINDRDTNGCTPLFTAVRAEAPTTVLRLLIEQGAEVDSAPEGEPTALALAAGMGSLEAVRVLVSAGADLSAAAENLGGETSLHLAAKNGSENVLCFLLAVGCWPGTKDNDGWTPLASACAAGRTGTASVLLTGEGWVLDHIPEEVPTDLRQHVLSFLVAAQGTPDLLGNSPLLTACENRGTPEVVDLLAKHGADFACKNQRGESALHVACRRGNAALAQYLLGCETLSRVSHAWVVEASAHATDLRGRRPGEVRDIDVGVHEAIAVRDVVGRDSVPTYF